MNVRATIFGALFLCTYAAAHKQAHSADEYFEMALSTQQKNEVIKYLQRTLALNPLHFQAHFHLANEYSFRDLHDNAIAHYQKAVHINPQSAEAHHNLGVLLAKLDDYHEEAYKHLTKALSHNPNYASAYFHRGKLLEKEGDSDGAITNYIHAIKSKDKHVESYVALAKIMRDRQNYETAILLLKKATSLQPKNIYLWFDLAFHANLIGQTDIALHAYKTILCFFPNHAQSHYNIGYTLKMRGDLDGAIESYRRALKINPDYQAAHFALAIALLNKGSFEEGWEQYCQKQLDAGKLNPEKMRQWVKNNEVAGKNLLFRHQGGLGDTFLFIRYVQELKKMGANTIVVVPKLLVPLLSNCNYIDSVVKTGDFVPAYDDQITLMSTPVLFNSSEKTIPKNIPYLFPDQKLVQYWKQYLTPSVEQAVQKFSKQCFNFFNIGLCWTADLHNDSSRPPVAHRSIPLELFAPFAQFDNIRFYSVQKNNDDLLDRLPNGLEIKTFGPDFDRKNGAFMDTAAVMQNLDLIITVDTSIAHLAGALGVPVWVILPFSVDWRWTAHRTDSVWYPTMRVFQQKVPMRWEPVLEEVIEALYELIDT